MPILKPCAAPGCRKLLPLGTTRCTIHQREQTDRENARRRTKQRLAGRDTQRWKKLRQAVLERDGHACTRCGYTAHLTIHLDPAHGGDHRTATVDDCTTLCRSCHGRADGGRQTGGRR